MYNWQQPDWTRFRYSLEKVEDSLYAFVEEIGLVSGLVKSLPEDTQVETIIDLMVSEAIKTSEIEGEFLSRQDVMSSIRNKLGLIGKHQETRDKRAAGAGELMVLVRNEYDQPLTETMLFAWHRALLSGSAGIIVGDWRSHEDPMQIVSGAYEKWKVHFEAPPSSAVKAEMDRFIEWFNATAPGGTQPIKSAPVRAAIAHLYFESIHPFEDGNGRIGRAIAEKALSQTIGRPVMLSLSQTIEADKKAYYEALMAAQRKNEITPWMSYFVPLVLQSQRQAREVINFTLQKTQFLDRHKTSFNERQEKAINRMFESGPGGFVGGMNASKYMGITKAPKATATRDLQALLEMGALRVEGGGRSTRYFLALEGRQLSKR